MTAEGSVYQRKKGRWCAQNRDAKDKTRYIYRKTKAEAKKALREALRDRDDNIIPPSKILEGAFHALGGNVFLRAPEVARWHYTFQV